MERLEEEAATETTPRRSAPPPAAAATANAAPAGRRRRSGAGAKIAVLGLDVEAAATAAIKAATGVDAESTARERMMNGKSGRKLKATERREKKPSLDFFDFVSEREKKTSTNTRSLSSPRPNAQRKKDTPRAPCVLFLSTLRAKNKTLNAQEKEEEPPRFHSYSEVTWAFGFFASSFFLKASRYARVFGVQGAVHFPFLSRTLRRRGQALAALIRTPSVVRADIQGVVLLGEVF